MLPQFNRNVGSVPAPHPGPATRPRDPAPRPGPATRPGAGPRGRTAGVARSAGWRDRPGPAPVPRPVPAVRPVAGPTNRPSAGSIGWGGGEGVDGAARHRRHRRGERGAAWAEEEGRKRSAVQPPPIPERQRLPGRGGAASAVEAAVTLASRTGPAAGRSCVAAADSEAAAVYAKGGRSLTASELSRCFLSAVPSSCKWNLSRSFCKLGRHHASCHAKP
jgi:hypothetical protein